MGAPWKSDTTYFATQGNPFEVLKWEVETGALWNSQACYNAAVVGYLEMLKWAPRERGAMERC